MVISRVDKDPCPVAIVEKFLEKGGHEPDKVIWRRVQNTKSGVTLKKSVMKYSWARELFTKVLEDPGLHARKYGLHTLRSGGATTAAALGIADRLLQRQGGWRTEKAKNNYIRESRSSLLQVMRTIQKM